MGNKGAPGLVVATVFPNEEGVPAYTSTFIDTIDHRTPFDRRWGGWYVTGTHGPSKHLGNAVGSNPFNPLDLAAPDSQNLTTLTGRFDVSKYLTGSSDIVALMTLEHQVGVANRLNATTFQYNRLRRDGLTDAEWTHLDGEIDDLVGYMLFVDEAPLNGPVKGVSTYMVYRELFDGLPAQSQRACLPPAVRRAHGDHHEPEVCGLVFNRSGRSHRVIAGRSPSP